MNRRGFLGVVGGSVSAAFIRLKPEKPVSAPKPVVESFESLVKMQLFNDKGKMVTESVNPVGCEFLERGVRFSDAHFATAKSNWGTLTSFVILNRKGNKIVAWGNVTEKKRVRRGESAIMSGVFITFN
jgi:hypothetical protein